MKKTWLLGLALLALPVVALAQGSQGVGTVDKPTARTAAQMGGQDPAGNLKLIQTDDAGRLSTVSAGGGLFGRY